MTTENALTGIFLIACPLRQHLRVQNGVKTRFNFLRYLRKSIFSNYMGSILLSNVISLKGGVHTHWLEDTWSYVFPKHVVLKSSCCVLCLTCILRL